MPLVQQRNGHKAMNNPADPEYACRCRFLLESQLISQRLTTAIFTAAIPVGAQAKALVSSSKTLP